MPLRRGRRFKPHRGNGLSSLMPFNSLQLESPDPRAAPFRVDRGRAFCLSTGFPCHCELAEKPLDTILMANSRIALALKRYQEPEWQRVIAEFGHVVNQRATRRHAIH